MARTLLLMIPPPVSLRPNPLLPRPDCCLCLRLAIKNSNDDFFTCPFCLCCAFEVSLFTLFAGSMGIVSSRCLGSAIGTFLLFNSVYFGLRLRVLLLDVFRLDIEVLCDISDSILFGPIFLSVQHTLDG